MFKNNIFRKVTIIISILGASTQICACSINDKPVITSTVSAIQTPVQSTSSINNLQIRKDSILGITFSYPKEWNGEVIDNIFTIKSTVKDKKTGSSGSISVQTEELTNDSSTFEQYKKIVAQKITEGNSFKMEKTEDKLFAGLPGCYMTYGGSIEKDDIKLYTAWTIKNKKSYSISYSGTSETFKSDFKDIEIIFQSFVIN